ncbi:hypothetical protein GCM10010271_70370 [Streptomyces kurssanovii]|nr:hypothetical protein GCM10010271_70370 [Streptomyces kurssanovii]
MNHHGAQMMRHWEAERPSEFAELEEVEEHFTQMGEEIAEQVELRARGLVGTVPPEEGYLARLQRLNTARLAAEGDVVREFLMTELPQAP